MSAKRESGGITGGTSGANQVGNQAGMAERHLDTKAWGLEAPRAEHPLRQNQPAALEEANNERLPENFVQLERAIQVC